jgi:hypothetical protein
MEAGKFTVLARAKQGEPAKASTSGDGLIGFSISNTPSFVFYPFFHHFEWQGFIVGRES